MTFKEIDFSTLNEGDENEKVEIEVEDETEKEPEVKFVEEVDSDNNETEDLSDVDDSTKEEDKDDQPAEEVSKKETETKDKKEAKEPRAQKRIRDLINQRKEVEAELAKEREEKLELAKAVKQSQKSSITSQKATYEARVSNAERALADALENEDHKAFVAAQKDLVTGQTQLMAIDNWEANQESKPEQVNKPTEDKNRQAEKAAASWAGRNSWYLQNGEKAKLTNSIAKMMQIEGLYDPTKEEFYDELDTRLSQVEEESSERTTVKEKTKKPPQTTAGGTQTPAPTKGGRKVVRLTAEDKRIANKMNIPLELYAKHKAASEKSGSGYVEINV